MNIAFPFVMLTSQNYIRRNRLYHGIWKNFTVLGTQLRMRNWDTMLESHGRLDKTMYGESNVKVCRSR